MKNLTDRNGNYIGNGDFHANYKVLEFPEYSGVISSVSKSETTESVYVTYSYNSNSITVRFSEHDNNAVKFGDQLNGFYASKEEILFKLELMKRVFVPNTYLSIQKQMVKKVLIETYEIADLTIKEMYALGAGADLSPYVGKIAKDSNYLIQGNKVELLEQKSINHFGESVRVGNYIYQ